MNDSPEPSALQVAVARLLTIGTYASVALMAVGVVLMIARERSPLDDGPRLEPGRLLSDLLELRPEGFLWLGIIVVVATPSLRVVATLVAYLQERERIMTGVSVAILAVIALSVALAVIAGAT